MKKLFLWLIETLYCPIDTSNMPSLSPKYKSFEKLRFSLYMSAYRSPSFGYANKDDFDETQLYDTEEYLMMYTCYPFDSLSTDQRYFVYAKKVSGPTIQEDGSWKK